MGRMSRLLIGVGAGKKRPALWRNEEEEGVTAEESVTGEIEARRKKI
jgi:hypothetical protein